MFKQHNYINSLVCPVSKKPLNLHGDFLATETTQYPIRKGIPDFLPEDQSEKVESIQTDYTISAKPWLSSLSGDYVQLTRE